MNILPVVIVMLMAFTIVTTTRLQSFLSVFKLQMQTRQYMQQAEKENFVSRAQNIYDDIPVSKREKAEQEERELLNPKLDIGIFLRQEENEKISGIEELLNKLIFRVYEDQDFFFEAQTKNSNVVDDLLQRMKERAKLPENSEKITSADKLARLDLGDEDLQYFFYKVLHGTQDIEAIDKRGYPPLTKFIKVSKSDKNLSVYLADRQLLLLFFPESIVAEIIETREDLYRQVRRKKDHQSKEEASKEFESFYAHYIPSQYRNWLDFRVTTTKPPEIKHKSKNL